MPSKSSFVIPEVRIAVSFGNPTKSNSIAIRSLIAESFGRLKFPRWVFNESAVRKAKGFDGNAAGGLGLKGKEEVEAYLQGGDQIAMST